VHGGNRRKVLVVDHDLPVACLCAEVLEEAGYDVFAAVDLPSAMAMLREHRFDAALVDVAMAGGAALDVVAALHATAPTAAVVGMTAEPAHLVRRRGYVDLHLHKPFRRLESIGLAVDAACHLVEHRVGAPSDSAPAL
jgi:two-component system OmpR family response regulator